MKKILFIGAPGFISTHAVNEACKFGYEVAVFKRSNVLDSDLIYSVKHYRGNRDRTEDLKSVKEQFRPDVVVDFVCYERKQAEQAVEVWQDAIQQYIFVSSVDFYGLPLSELPYPEGSLSPIGHPTTDYAVKKGECETVFMNAYLYNKFPITIARPFYSIHKRALVNLFSGRDWNNEGGRTLVERIRFRQPVIVPGDGTTLFQAGCARNHGRMITRLVGADFAIGESYNCAHNTVITIDEYMQQIGLVLGVEPVIIHIPSDLLLSLDVQEIHNGYIPTMLQYNTYYSVEKFHQNFPDFCWECTLQDALREYLQWNESQRLFRKEPYEYVEDRLIAAWREASQKMKNVLGK